MFARACYVSITGMPRVVLQQQCSCVYERIQTAYSITRTARGKNYLRDTRWRSETWDRTTCFAGTERRITRSVLERNAQGSERKRNEGREREMDREREREREREKYVHVYGIIIQPPVGHCCRKSLTSCWRAAGENILCAACGTLRKKRGKGKKGRRMGKNSLPRG